MDLFGVFFMDEWLFVTYMFARGIIKGGGEIHDAGTHEYRR